MQQKLIAAALGFLLLSSAPALPRHGLFGAAPGDRPKGLTVLRVIPGSAAAVAGVRAGDVITRLGTKPIKTVVAFLDGIHHYHANDTVDVRLVRNGAPLTIRTQLKAAPNEQDPQVTTIYSQISVQNTLQRTLITLPKAPSSPRPAVLFIGGIGCYSIDVAANPEDPYLRLAHDLSRAGFVTMRVEKSGIGDSQGAPCRTVDFNSESRSYAIALEALKRDARVDANHVYLFGHSIGSLIAPRLALANRVAGVVVAEAVGRDWIEYELRNTRRQLELGGTAAADVDKDMLQKASCMQQLLIERRPEVQIEKAEPYCKEPNGVYPVTAAYVEQVAPLNIIQAWMLLDVPVLVIYGASDFVTEQSDHERIVNVVNQAHPGKASLQIIQGMDHILGVAPTPQVSYANSQKTIAEAYDADFSRAIIAWLCSHEACA